MSGWALRSRFNLNAGSRRRSAQISPVLSGHSLSTAQLLAWIDAATQGWLVLTPDLTIGFINSRAERLLQFSSNRLVRGQALDDVLSVPQLEEAMVSVRYQQRPQRCEWEQQGVPIESIVLPGSDEWLLVLLHRELKCDAF